MGHSSGVTQHWHDLVRGAGEPRWTAVVDAALACSVVLWVLLLSFFDPSETVRTAVPLVLVVAVVARVLVLVEYSQRWRDTGRPDLAAQDAQGADDSSRAAA